MPKSSVLWIVLGASLLVWLAGCTPPMRSPQPTPQATAAPLPEAGVLAIVDALARPAPLPGGTSAIYFTVLNGLDQSVQLVSAASPAARAVETHETVAEEGVMKMIPLPDGYPVPAGTTLVLQPGGKHIMLIDLVEPLAPGDTIELTVTFDNGQVFELNVPVLDPQLNRPVDAEGREALGGPQDQPVIHDHESMQGEAAPHEHAQMHGDNTALSPELAAALEALPVGAIHQLDEALAQGSDWDADAARTTVDDLIAQLDAFSWPEDLLPSIETIRTHAVDLHDAIEAGDPARVGELAAALHHLLHALDQPVIHDHESMQGEAAPHEHAQMHGDNTALSPELAAALEALPVGAIHQLDEALAQGSDWDADAARTTVDDLIAQLDAFSWPEDLLPSIETIRTHAVDLHDAIEAGDPARVGELAAALHHLLHALAP